MIRRELYLADLHVHPHTEFAAPETISLSDGRGIASNSRLAAQHRALLKYREVAALTHVDRTWFLGDVFHVGHLGRVPVDAMEVVVDAIADWPGEVRILAGNHDRHSVGQPDPLSALLSPSVRVFRDFDFTSPGHGLDFYVAPYGPDVADRIAAVSTEHRKRGVLLAHADVAGAALSGSEIVGKTGLGPDHLAGWALVLGGHVHRRQKLAENAWIVGPPWQHSFVEEGFEIGAASVVYGLEQGPLVDFVDGSGWSPKFRTFKPSPDEIAETKNAAEFERNAGNFVRVILPASTVQHVEIDGVRVDKAAPVAAVPRVKFGDAGLLEILERYVAAVAVDESAEIVAAGVAVAHDAATKSPGVAFPRLPESKG